MKRSNRTRGKAEYRTETPERAARWSGRFPLWSGITALVLLVAGLGAWSFGTTLAGAVIAQGIVQVESNRQVVQHPQGGVIDEILVKNSDAVRKGEVLIRLDGRRLKSERSIVERQLLEIGARKARLIAERDNAKTIDFSQLSREGAATPPGLEQIMQGEATLFHARREAIEQERSLLAKQNDQIESRILGIRAQISALRVQAELVLAEQQSQERLLEQQLSQAGRVSELRREHAGLQGQIGQLEAELGALRGEVTSNEITALQLETRRREDAVTQLRDLEFREIELAERLIVLNDSLSRLEIRAPVAGIVYGMSVFAVEAVVQAAEPLLYIIPQDQPLVVSTRIEAIHIDEIYQGQEAELRFPAFDQRRMPEIRGQVTRISADVLEDQATGLSFYTAEVLPLDAELHKLGEQALLPGMPVEAYLRTRDRTPIDYLTEPLTIFFTRAFRE